MGILFLKQLFGGPNEQSWTGLFSPTFHALYPNFYSAHCQQTGHLFARSFFQVLDWRCFGPLRRPAGVYARVWYPEAIDAEGNRSQHSSQQEGRGIAQAVGQTAAREGRER